VGRLSGLSVLVVIVGRPVGAMLALCVEVVLAEELLVEEEPTEVVVNVGRAVSVLVREGALALVRERFASLFEVVAAAAALPLVVDMMGGGWEVGRPVRYLLRVDAGVMHEGWGWR
jgi:hypothetical protein